MQIFLKSSSNKILMRAYIFRTVAFLITQTHFADEDSIQKR